MSLQSSIPTTLLTMAASAATSAPSPSISISGTELGFLGTELSEQNGFDGAEAAASGSSTYGNGGIFTALPHPNANVFPGSSSTNPTSPYYFNPNPTSSPQNSPSSAVVGIICVALVFTSVLIVVGLWQLKERRDLKRASNRSEKNDVEKGTVDGREKGGNLGVGGNGMENFIHEGFLGTGEKLMMGKDGKMVTLGNGVMVTEFGVVGERTLRIL